MNLLRWDEGLYDRGGGNRAPVPAPAPRYTQLQFIYLLFYFWGDNIHFRDFCFKLWYSAAFEWENLSRKWLKVPHYSLAVRCVCCLLSTDPHLLDPGCGGDLLLIYGRGYCCWIQTDASRHIGTQPHWPQTLTSMENLVPCRHQPSPCGGECLYQCQYIGVWGADRKLSAGPSCPVVVVVEASREIEKLSRKYLVRVKYIWCEHKISGESIKYLLHCIAV